MLIIIGGTVFIYIVTLAYVSIGFYKRSVREAKEQIDIYTRNKANQIAAALNEDMGISRSLAQTLSAHIDDSEEDRYNYTKSMLSNVLKGNSKYISTWVSWEYNFVKEGWPNPFGRQLLIYSNPNGNIIETKKERDINGDVEGSIYYSIKKSKKEELTEPYYDYIYTDDVNGEGKRVLVTSVSIPVMSNKDFVGLVGADISLANFLKEAIIDDFEDSYAVVTTNEGTLIAHPDEDFLSYTVDTLAFSVIKDNPLSPKIKQGQEFSLTTYKSGTGKQLYVSFAPIPIGRSGKPWSVGVIVPDKEIERSFWEVFLVTLIVAIIGLSSISLICWRILDQSTTTILKMRDLLKNLALGKIDVDAKLKVDDTEIGEMANSINELTLSLSEKARFSSEIGHGHLEAPFELKNEEDALGKSLIDMRDNLKENQIAAQQRRWVNEGLNQFAELIQAGGEDVEDFAASVASELVSYMDAKQIGIFLINDEEGEPFLELKGAYAYDRRKYLNKKIYFKEGLVGQCVLEKAPIYLLDVPQDYLNITSGLGQANPRCLLIVPLMVNEEVFGAMEIASFKPFEKYQVDFLEKLGENIASNISNVKITQKTKHLLSQSQEQAEQLRSQEEEMRQNMEELQATQEELSRKSRDTEKTLDELQIWQGNVRAILNGMPQSVIVTDIHTGIEDMNEAGERVLGLSQETVLGRSVEDFFEGIQINSELIGQEIDTQVKTHQGEYKDVEVHVLEINKMNGKKIMLVFVEKQV